MTSRVSLVLVVQTPFAPLIKPSGCDCLRSSILFSLAIAGMESASLASDLKDSFLALLMTCLRVLRAFLTTTL